MIEGKKLKKGDYILYKDEPHVIKEIGIAVYGTHSHAKLKLEVQGLFSNKHENFTLPIHDAVEEIEIIRKHGQVVSKTSDKIQIMDMRSYETMDAGIGQELLNEISEGDEITFVEFKNKSKILEKR